MVIPPFGAAVAPYSIVFYSMHSFSEAQNPYAVRQPTPMKPSLIPGHYVMLPDDTLVCPRLAPNQMFDKNIQTEYHKALQAIFQMKSSHNSFYVQELGTGCTMSTSMDKRSVYMTAKVQNTNYQTTIKERLLEISGKYYEYVLLQQEL